MDEYKQPLLKFDNHVSFGHIITTLTVIVAGISYAFSMENRVKNLELKDVDIINIIEANRADRKEQFKEIQGTLWDISKQIAELNARKADRK